MKRALELKKMVGIIAITPSSRAVSLNWAEGDLTNRRNISTTSIRINIISIDYRGINGKQFIIHRVCQRSAIDSAERANKKSAGRANKDFARRANKDFKGSAGLANKDFAGRANKRMTYKPLDLEASHEITEKVILTAGKYLNTRPRKTMKLLKGNLLTYALKDWGRRRRFVNTTTPNITKDNVLTTMDYIKAMPALDPLETIICKDCDRIKLLPTFSNQKNISSDRHDSLTSKADEHSSLASRSSEHTTLTSNFDELSSLASKADEKSILAYNSTKHSGLTSKGNELSSISSKSDDVIRQEVANVPSIKDGRLQMTLNITAENVKDEDDSKLTNLATANKMNASQGEIKKLSSECNIPNKFHQDISHNVLKDRELRANNIMESNCFTSFVRVVDKTEIVSNNNRQNLKTLNLRPKGSYNINHIGHKINIIKSPVEKPNGSIDMVTEKTNCESNERIISVYKQPENQTEISGDNTNSKTNSARGYHKDFIKNIAIHEYIQIKTAANIDDTTKQEPHDVQDKTFVQVKERNSLHNESKHNDEKSKKEDCEYKFYGICSDCLTKFSNKPFENTETNAVQLNNSNKINANIYSLLKPNVIQAAYAAFQNVNFENTNGLLKKPLVMKNLDEEAAAIKKRKKTVVFDKFVFQKALQPPRAVVKRKKVHTAMPFPKRPKTKSATEVSGNAEEYRMVGISETLIESLGDYMRILMKDYQRYIQSVLRDRRPTNIDLNKLCFFQNLLGVAISNVAHANDIANDELDVQCRDFMNLPKALDRPGPGRVRANPCQISTILKPREKPVYGQPKKDVIETKSYLFSASALIDKIHCFIKLPYQYSLSIMMQTPKTIMTVIGEKLSLIDTFIFKATNNPSFGDSILLARDFEPWVPIPWLPYFFDSPCPVKHESTIEWPVKRKTKKIDYSKIRNPAGELPLPPK